MSEKIGGAKGTELDDDFILMEKVCACLLTVHFKKCIVSAMRFERLNEYTKVE